MSSSSRKLSHAAFWLLPAVVLTVAPAGRAQTVVAPAATDAMATGLADLLELPPLRSWELTGSLHLKGGYKDNLLLSAVQREGSPFARAEAEVFWWRLPTARFEAVAFANARLTHFTSTANDRDESEIFAHGEGRWFINPSLRATFTVQGYYLDQMFDLSTSSTDKLIAKLQVTGGIAFAVLRWEMAPQTWLELKPATQRDRYHDHSDDNRQHSGRVTIGRNFGPQVEASLAAQVLQRKYDSRNQYDLIGSPLIGTQLNFRQHEGELRLAATWDTARHWQTVTKVGVLTNQDNGTGYFDFTYRSVRQELKWMNGPWELRFTIRAGRYNYAVQTAGTDPVPPKRMKEDVGTELQVGRKFGERLTAVWTYEWERAHSNDPLASYRVNTVSGGVDWNF